MKIVLFNSFYYPRFVGGAEISVKLLAEGLTEQGNRVYVITIGDQNKVERINGVTVIRIKHRNVFSPYQPKQHSKPIKMLWLLLDAFNPLYHLKLKYILKRLEPDVVHTNNVMGFSPTIWATIKQLKIPLLHTMRDYYLLCHKTNMFNKGKNCNGICAGCGLTQRIKKMQVNRPDIYVGVSNFILGKHHAFLKTLSANQKRVVYNAIEMPAEIRITSRPRLVIGYIGRIAEDKGFGYLIQQINELQKKYPHQFSFLVAGVGEQTYVDDMKKRLEGMKFEFLGKIKPETFYSRVDITIVPSQWNEPFGRVAIESLAYGVPACIADSGGLTEIHNEACTWLFKPEGSNLANLLSNIVSNPQTLTVKKKVSRFYAAKFENGNNVASYFAIYTELSAKKTKTANDKLAV